MFQLCFSWELTTQMTTVAHAHRLKFEANSIELGGLGTFWAVLRNVVPFWPSLGELGQC